MALGTGAASYFALPAEPLARRLAWIGADAGLRLPAQLAIFRAGSRWPLALLAALLLGFAVAKLREGAVATPVLDRAVVAAS